MDNKGNGQEEHKRLAPGVVGGAGKKGAALPSVEEIAGTVSKVIKGVITLGGLILPPAPDSDKQKR